MLCLVRLIFCVGKVGPTLSGITTIKVSHRIDIMTSVVGLNLMGLK